MDVLGVRLYPDLLEESWRELERERRRDREIKEARAARRAAQPSRLVALTARIRNSRRQVFRRGPGACPEPT